MSSVCGFVCISMKERYEKLRDTYAEVLVADAVYIAPRRNILVYYDQGASTLHSPMRIFLTFKAAPGWALIRSSVL